MTRAALYARFSTERQTDASIQGQFRNCEAYCEREGWTIVDRYGDEAISGRKTDRPGYQRMLADAEAGRFDVLVVDDLSRLSRDEIETKLTVRRFQFRGLRIVGISDGYDSAAKGAKVHAGVRGLINDIYIDDLREKTHRGLAGKALQGFNTGGRCYGYRHLPIEDPSKLDEHGRPVIVAVKREIDEEQANWVRRIFGWYADGWSSRRISAELNRLGVPGPRKGPWSASTIYGEVTKDTGFLNNQLYVGRYIWNRSANLTNPDTGKKRRTLRPREEWIVTEMPELRIVDEETWQRVKTRQAEQRRKSANVRKAMHERARTGAGPKYLFSGLLKCGCCGANYVIADRRRYGCVGQRNWGDSVCNNRLRVDRKLAEERLLDGIKRDLFTDAAFELFQTEAARLLREHAVERRTGLDRLKRKLRTVNREVDNVMSAIKAGVVTASTKDELLRLEAKRERLRHEMDGIADAGPDIVTELPNAMERYTDLVQNLEAAVAGDIPLARQPICRRRHSSGPPADIRSGWRPNHASPEGRRLSGGRGAR